MESDLKQDDLLKVLKKHHSCKAAFNFKTEMHAQLKTQRALIVFLLMASNKAVKAKKLVYDILEECGMQL